MELCWWTPPLQCLEIAFIDLNRASDVRGNMAHGNKLYSSFGAGHVGKGKMTGTRQVLKFERSVVNCPHLFHSAQES